jgi:thiol-disulfide isomerase/thioredoxin
MGNAARTRAKAQARTAAAAQARTAAAAQARTAATAQNVPQKLAARRAADQRAVNHGAGARRRILLAGGSVAIVIALLATLIAVKLTQSQPRSAPAANAATTAQVQQQVTSVPAATFNAVGAGTATGLNTVTGQPALTAGGKPELLYVGGEFCPYCAAERWALAAAVSRFGTLSGLSLIHSSPTDVYANTPTLSFAKASYASKYLAFVPVEWYGEAADPSTPFGHVYLQQPTAQEQALFDKYGGGSIPFVDIGNRYFLPQVQYIPSALAGLTWTQVAAAMRDPSSAVARDIDGAANVITAAICTLTHGQPGGVCQSAGVKAAASRLGSI